MRSLRTTHAHAPQKQCRRRDAHVPRQPVDLTVDVWDHVAVAVQAPDFGAVWPRTDRSYDLGRLVRLLVV
jgi:hypothetical protein